MSNAIQYYTPDKSKSIFFCADLHGFHKNICSGVSDWSDKSGCRQFDNQYTMTNHMVDVINKTVDSNDILYCLGDWSFGGKDNIKRLRDMIKCQTIILILGNHDHHIRNNIDLQSLFTHVSAYEEFYYRKKLVCCSHYPFGSWNEIGRGSLNLHGHSHGTYKPIGRQMDVGVDCHDFKPVKLEDAIAQLRDKEVARVDHHDDKTNYH